MLEAEACDAEILGALKSLEAAMEVDRNSSINILIGCQTAVSSLRLGQAKSSQTLADRFTAKLDYAKTWKLDGSQVTQK